MMSPIFLAAVVATVLLLNFPTTFDPPFPLEYGERHIWTALKDTRFFVTYVKNWTCF